MRKTCAQCGKSFEAQRSTAKYCSSSCRANASTGVAPVAQLKSPVVPVSGSLSASVRERVELAELASTPDGLAAILLAEQLEQSVDGSKTAALYGKFAVAMDRLDALAPRQGAMDELRLRRDRKRARPA